MASLTDMPAVHIDPVLLRTWSGVWSGTRASASGKTKKAKSFDKKQGMDFGKEVFDPAVAKALSKMLGDVPIKPAKRDSLLPPEKNCIELGDTRVIGGIRPQNFDLAYRPDGMRIAYDSKTLNDAKSIQKNWQNMINDLATEATTIHTRFPYAIVIFLVIVPKQALQASQEFDMIRTLERLATRKSVQDHAHLAEAISLVVWDAQHGTIDAAIPISQSHLRLEQLPKIVTTLYLDRYKGLPPHDRS